MKDFLGGGDRNTIIKIKVARPWKKQLRSKGDEEWRPPVT